MRQRWSGDNKRKRQGYRIVRAAARQSHGMEPNFIHWLYILYLLP